MSIHGLTLALKPILQGPLAHCEMRAYEDAITTDMWYVLFVDKVVQFPGTFVDLHGRISPQFMLDPTLKALSVQALFQYDARNGDVTCHFIGHGKLHLPGIANSAGLKYGIIDVQMSVAQYMSHLPTTQCPVVTTREAQVTSSGSQCDCGGRKAGYADDQLYGHAHWCDLVRGSRLGKVTHGNGD